MGREGGHCVVGKDGVGGDGRLVLEVGEEVLLDCVAVIARREVLRNTKG